MRQKPLISIVLTYYKKRKYVWRTLQSILLQNYKNFELIFVYDDGDLKDYKYIKKILIKFKKKKVLFNKKNLGVSQSRNKALEICKGKFIAFIDADDIWIKSKLSKQQKIMQKNLLNFSFTSYNVINNNNKLINKRFVNKDPTYVSLQKKNIIGLSTVMFNRKILKDVKFPNLKTQEDFALWLNLLKKGHKLSHIQTFLSSWRKQMTHSLQTVCKKLLTLLNYIIIIKIKI